ncbi:hypothetical protein GOV12_05225 [Candidatus Pacearchaeota archaeon]|nr:hypothetical protein [Candidatus Pacearchaeota archaeon]
MFWIIHILIGIIIGLVFHPLAIIPIALLSHFIFDSLPHWDGDFDKKSFQKTGIAKIKKSVIIIRGLDMILALAILSYFLYLTKNNLILLGAFFALFPDLIKVGYLTNLKKNKTFKSYLNFHSKIQKDTKPLIGLITQIILAIILIYMIFSLI